MDSIMGVDQYDKSVFSSQGIDLGFLKMGEVIYPQLGNDFVPYLSILDVMMFNSAEVIHDYLNISEKHD
jgi:hypothetical protein